MSLYSDSAPTLSEPTPYPLSPEPNFSEPLLKPLPDDGRERVWCPVYQGTFICAVCCRSGRDLRSLFCRVRTGRRDGVR
jgi:hypothetical protein